MPGQIANSFSQDAYRKENLFSQGQINNNLLMLIGILDYKTGGANKEKKKKRKLIEGSVADLSKDWV